MWKHFNKEKPLPGSKIVLVSDDGCSSILALVVIFDTDSGMIALLDGETGDDVTVYFGIGSIWAYLPIDYPLHFMEQTEADWY